MGGSLNAFVLILLAVSLGESFELENDSLEDPQNNLKEFIFEHHKETRELMKAEIDRYFTRLSDSLHEKWAAIETEMQKSFNTRLSNTDLKVESMERSLLKLSEELNQHDISSGLKIEKSLYNLTQACDLRLSESETKILSGLKDEEKESSGTRRELFKAKLPTRVEVEKLSLDSGTIEFIGGSNLSLKRKIWVLMSEGRYSYPPSASFVMTENRLGENAQLSVWGDNGGLLHVWSSSQTNWSLKNKTTDYNNLIVVTLTVTPSTTPDPPISFKLRYTVTRSTDSYARLGEVISKEAMQSISFPTQNAQGFPSNTLFHAVLAPKNGLPFKLTLKFLDMPSSPPTCSGGSLYVFLFEEGFTGGDYKHVERNNTGMRCGSPGDITEILGTSTIAIFRVWSTSGGGRGFRVEIDST